MPRSPGSADKSYLLRLPAADLDEIRRASEAFGRKSVAEEFRLMVQLHILRHRRAYAESKDGQAFLKAQGLNPKRQLADLDEQIRELTDELYVLPDPDAEAPEEPEGPAWRLPPRDRPD